MQSFRLVRQADQDVFVEVWCEAADLSGRLAVVADPYGVPVYSGGGFDGLKGKRAAAARAASRSVPTIALQIGDFDVHGGWIFGAVAEDAAAWVPSYLPDAPSSRSGPWTYRSGAERVTLHDGDETVLLDVRRFAVTEAQIEAGLAELDDDGKAEADQLPADWQILAAELDVLLDARRREQVLEREVPERDRLREKLAERWSA